MYSPAVMGMDTLPSAVSSTVPLALGQNPRRRMGGFFLWPLLRMQGGQEKTATGKSGSKTIFSTSQSVDLEDGLVWKFVYLISGALLI